MGDECESDKTVLLEDGLDLENNEYQNDLLLNKVLLSNSSNPIPTIPSNDTSIKPKSRANEIAFTQAKRETKKSLMR